MEGLSIQRGTVAKGLTKTAVLLKGGYVDFHAGFGDNFATSKFKT